MIFIENWSKLIMRGLKSESDKFKLGTESIKKQKSVG